MIRLQVETGNIGKVLVINVDTGEYEMDRDHLAASDRAAPRYPGAPLYAMRVGMTALGRLRRSSRSMIQSVSLEVLLSDVTEEKRHQEWQIGLVAGREAW